MQYNIDKFEQIRVNKHVLNITETESLTKNRKKQQKNVSFDKLEVTYKRSHLVSNSSKRLFAYVCGCGCVPACACMCDNFRFRFITELPQGGSHRHVDTICHIFNINIMCYSVSETQHNIII